MSTCSKCGHDDGILHQHRWTYQPMLNALICRCGDRFPLDSRLPAALKAAKATFPDYREILNENAVPPARSIDPS